MSKCAYLDVALALALLLSTQLRSDCGDPLPMFPMQCNVLELSLK